MFPASIGAILGLLWPLLALITICQITSTSSSQPEDTNTSTLDWPIYLGRTGGAAKEKRRDHDYACAEEHGVCTALTHCMDGTVHLDGRNYLIDGHKTRLCPHVYDVCCIPDEGRIREFRNDWEKRMLQQLLNRKAEKKAAAAAEAANAATATNAKKLRNLIGEPDEADVDA